VLYFLNGFKPETFLPIDFVPSVAFLVADFTESLALLPKFLAPAVADLNDDLSLLNILNILSLLSVFIIKKRGLFPIPAQSIINSV